ncbi:hypothetical protein WDV93_01465 [Pantoea ananatis]
MINEGGCQARRHQKATITLPVEPALICPLLWVGTALPEVKIKRPVSSIR